MVKSSNGRVLAVAGEFEEIITTASLLIVRSRVEEHPPWDDRCEFYQLRKQCLDFKASLPRQQTLTPQNTQAHITMKSSTPYTLIHTVYLLCQIMLHREYVPFIPIRCTKPEGPLDPPLFPPEKYNVPPGFWEDSARECFKAARNIMDLISSCQEWNALVETPIVGFAMYTVAFVGVYCINFPQMDPEGYMCTPKSADKANGVKIDESKGFAAARKSLEMIGTMRPKIHMADGWFKTINRMHRYFKRMKSDYKKNTAAIESGASESDGSPMSSRHLSLREGGIGGGLDEFKLLERTLKDFGNLEDQQDMEMTDARPSSGTLDNMYDDSNSGTTVKSEDGEQRPGATDPPPSGSGAWNAVNTAPDPSADRNGSVATPSSGQFRPWNSYQQPSQQPQLPPPPQQPQQSYAHQINNFRPVGYGPESASGPGAPPSLTSPGSHTTSPSNPSPPFERQHQQYSNWAAQPSGYSLPSHHQHQPYPNGIPHPHTQQPTPMPTGGPYPTPNPPAYQPMSAPPPMQEQHHLWNPMERDAWLKSVEAPIAGDDIAAFVDGGEMADWAKIYGGGWLSAVWGGTGQGP